MLFVQLSVVRILRKLTPQEQKIVAAYAEVDPRTVARMLEGKPTRPMVKARIIRALEKVKP